MAGSPIGLLSPSRAIFAEPFDDGNVVAREVVVREELTNFHFDDARGSFFVVDHVALVQEDDDVGDADLAGEQDVLTRLGHRTVSGGHDEDRAVHLGGTRNHVLHVVGVPRAVDVRVVAVGGFVFNVRRVDRDATGLFFREPRRSGRTPWLRRRSARTESS